MKGQQFMVAVSLDVSWTAIWSFANYFDIVVFIPFETEIILQAI